MSVTELALLQFKEPLTGEIKELMDYCQTVQDTWVLRQKPGLPPTRVARGTAILQQVENPQIVLMAAQWDSPEAHGEWIVSPENRNVMAKLAPHIHTEGPQSVLFFHVDAPIFVDATPGRVAASAPSAGAGAGAGAETADMDADADAQGKKDDATAEPDAKDKAPEDPAPVAKEEEEEEEEEESKADGKKKAEDAPPNLLTAPVLSVGRFGVRPEQKEDFVKKYADAKWVVEQSSKPYPVRGGWRIERAVDGLEEFVMYCGWSSVEQHKGIAEHEGFKEWAGIQEFVTGTDIWHYKRLL